MKHCALSCVYTGEEMDSDEDSDAVDDDSDSGENAVQGKPDISKLKTAEVTVITVSVCVCQAVTLSCTKTRCS